MGGRGSAGRARRRPSDEQSVTVLGAGAGTATAVLERELSPHEIQDLVPVRWNYGSRAVDPDSAGLVDADAVSAAIDDYVYEKPGSDRRLHGKDLPFDPALDDPSVMAQPYVNAALRGTVPMTPQREHTIEILDQALDASRIPEPVTVLRGYANGTYILPEDWQTRDLTGLTWTDPAYTSTTADPEGAETYAGAVEDRGFAVRLHLPAGTSALTIRDEPGGLDDEGEVVLPRGLHFRVTRDRGVQGDYGIRWLDVEATPGP
jgi:hypothetical protein